jgi:hypothetical protein
LKQALEEVRYLVNRGYPKDSAIRFVSNHRRLPIEQRFVPARVVVASNIACRRLSKAVPLEALHEKAVFVDGYNVLIIVESILAGCSVYLSDDGFLRDTRGIFRSYRASEFTVPALSEILDVLIKAGPDRVEVLLDQQISMSGQLAAQIAEMMARRSLAWTARTVRDVDRQLKMAQGIVATADGNVIDASSQVIDLPNWIAKGKGMSIITI